MIALPGKTYVARHGETVFNAAGRMQGDAMDTPLTRAGFAQADAMGTGLAAARPGPLTLWSSPYGRALQTLAIVAEHLGEDWHQARQDARLAEINVGAWGGRSYRDIVAEQGDIVDRAAALFSVRPPGGEWYDEIAARLNGWIADAAAVPGDRLVIMHGMSARVLRGLLTGVPHEERWGCGVAPNLPQGTLVVVEDGRESVVHLGTGAGGARAA